MLNFFANCLALINLRDFFLQQKTREIETIKVCQNISACLLEVREAPLLLEKSEQRKKSSFLTAAPKIGANANRFVIEFLT